MMLTIDFETRSKVDIKLAGSWNYAESPTTEVMCLALKEDDRAPVIWIPERADWLAIACENDIPLVGAGEVIEMVSHADMIEAHNAHFEIAIWHHVCHLRMNWPDLKPTKVFCSMAKAARLSLPLGLDKLGAAIGAKEQKDSEGHRIMLKMSKPRRPSKLDKSPWWEKPSDLVALWRYCIQDVVSEHCISAMLPPLPAPERKLWLHDLTVNRRGIPVDLPTARAMVGLVNRHSEKLLGEMTELTGGEVDSPRQTAAFRKYLAGEGVSLVDLKKETVAECLEMDSLPPKARRLLEIRSELSQASVAKYTKMEQMACSDDRVRGSLQYHAASTGRWGGRGIQIQNFTRRKVICPDLAAEVVCHAPDDVEFLFGPVISFASDYLRSTLVSSPGHDLVCADYSSIEGRVLAWLAEEEWVLEAYRNDEGMYEISASLLYNVPVEEVTGDQRQIGKVCELALGYQGSTGAFVSMASNYGVNLPEDEVKKLVAAWRERRPQTVRLWFELERAAISAVKNRGISYYYAGCAFEVKGSFLMIRLPSGRTLWYYDPIMREMMQPWGDVKESLTYMGVDSTTSQWSIQKTYGGKLAENITQACARDILAAGIMHVEAAGYPVLFHVHDECVSEVPEGFGSVEEYETLLATPSTWANTIPLAAKGWRGKRYKK
jgi:DNA polymerase bacteriophage-type